jgi:hypothetical protein
MRVHTLQLFTLNSITSLPSLLSYPDSISNNYEDTYTSRSDADDMSCQCASAAAGRIQECVGVEMFRGVGYVCYACLCTEDEYHEGKMTSEKMMLVECDGTGIVRGPAAGGHEQWTEMGPKERERYIHGSREVRGRRISQRAKTVLRACRVTWRFAC